MWSSPKCNMGCMDPHPNVNTRNYGSSTLRSEDDRSRMTSLDPIGTPCLQDDDVCY